MKTNLLFAILFLQTALPLCAQTDQAKYPEPEFTNEISFLKKDGAPSTMRLEKASSKLEAKIKGAGFGGSENGYTWEGSRSTVRFAGSNNISFVYSTGASASASSPSKDSMMMANGIDPSMMSGGGSGLGGLTDPSNTISLYKAESSKGERKIIMQKTPGASPFGSKKMKSADKYTLSVKKIRDGYWELVVDKPLPKGEYAFTMTNMMNMSSGDGSSVLFAFGVD